MTQSDNDSFHGKGYVWQSMLLIEEKARGFESNPIELHEIGSAQTARNCINPSVMKSQV